MFHVRDQATGYSLAWTATENETSVPVLRILRELFAKYGAPLVIKCDNGSAFINEEMKAFLQEMGVHQHFSPPRKPSYNGGVERGNGIQGAATRHEAKRNGRDGYWMTDDLNAARERVNATRRTKGTIPSEEWEARRPIEETTRQAFQATFAEEQRLEFNAVNQALLAGANPEDIYFVTMRPGGEFGPVVRDRCGWCQHTTSGVRWISGR